MSSIKPTVDVTDSPAAGAAHETKAQITRHASFSADSLNSGDDESDIKFLRERSRSGYASRLARHVHKMVQPTSGQSGLSTPVNPIGTPSIGTMTESIKSFVMGNERFRRIHFAEHEKALLESIKHGQRPKALFMGCSDSRVLPDAMMQVRAGDLFVSRNIGAFVAPYTRSPAHAGTTSVIQYAVTVLGVQDIIVCSHSYCGACAALFNLESLEHDEEAPQLRAWLRLGERARDLALSALGPDAPRDTLLRTTEKLAAVCQLEHLMTHPYVRRKMDEGKLFLHAWHYQIESGQIEYYDSHEHDFRPLDHTATDSSTEGEPDDSASPDNGSTTPSPRS